jgi:hypothetical protein
MATTPFIVERELTGELVAGAPGQVLARSGVEAFAGERSGESRLPHYLHVSLYAPLGRQSPRVAVARISRFGRGGRSLSVGRVFVPMVCDGSLLAGYVLRLRTLGLCNKRLLTSDWRG